VLVLLDGARTVGDLLGRQAAGARLATARRLFVLDACGLIRATDV
jgi:hypothetical protein